MCVCVKCFDVCCTVFYCLRMVECSSCVILALLANWRPHSPMQWVLHGTWHPKSSEVILRTHSLTLSLLSHTRTRTHTHAHTHTHTRTRTHTGTCYMASCDVYSFGVVLWEMITRHKPYLSGTRGKNMPPHAVLYRVANGVCVCVCVVK